MLISVEMSLLSIYADNEEEDYFPFRIPKLIKESFKKLVNFIYNIIHN